MHLVLQHEEAKMVKAALQEFYRSVEGIALAIELLHRALRTTRVLKRQRDMFLRKLRVKHIHIWNCFLRHCLPSIMTYATVQEQLLDSLFLPSTLDPNLVPPEAWPLLYSACLDACDQCHTVLGYNRELQLAWERYSPYIQNIVVTNADFPELRLCGWIRKREASIQTVDHLTRRIRGGTAKVSYSLIKLRAYFIDQAHNLLDYKGFDIRVHSNAAQVEAWYGVRTTVTEAKEIVRRERIRLISLDT
ncbi:hypothetical protein FRC03_012868 [Tulasnella sp. 419]|nr:hypothetical protein FRC03_012868 [Tulasnella sp. 419]